MTQPQSSGTARLHPLSRSFSLTTEAEAVEYTEHRGHDAPPASLGAPGDIYLDLKTPALYSRGADGWTKWPGPGARRVAHPAHPDYVLWASIQRSRVLWVSKHKHKMKLIGSAAEILKQIIESEGRRDSKILKRKADGDDTAGTGGVKKPRASEPSLASDTKLSPLASAASLAKPALLAPSTAPLPPSSATKSVEAPSKQTLSPASAPGGARLSPVAYCIPPAVPPTEKPALLPIQAAEAPSKQTTFPPTLAAAVPPLKPPKSPTKPTPSTSGPPDLAKPPNKHPVQPHPPPSPKAAVPCPTISPSLKRPAPKASEDDGPRVKRQRMEPPSPAAIKTAMQPVQRELAQLKEGRVSSDTKKRFLLILGRHITQVLDGKEHEHDREQWQTVLWEYVAQSWPKKPEWTRLEKEFKKMVKADSGRSRASSDVSTPAASQPRVPPSLSSPAPATSIAVQRKTGWDSGAASASAPVPKPAGVPAVSVPSPVETSALVPDGGAASGSLPVRLAPVHAPKPPLGRHAQVPVPSPAAKPSWTPPVVPPIAKPAPVSDSGPSSARSLPATPNPVRAPGRTSTTKVAAKPAVSLQSRTASPPPVVVQAPVSDTESTSAPLTTMHTVVGNRTPAPTPAAKPTAKPTAQMALVPRPKPAALIPDAVLVSTPSVAKPTAPVAEPIATPMDVRSASSSQPASAPLPLAAKAAQVQDPGTVSAPALAGNTELDELLTVLRSNTKILKAAYTQPASSPVFEGARTAQAVRPISSSPATPVIPHPTRIAALRRQYAKYRSEADSERQTSHQWRAETAASAALIDVLTMANDALTGENDAIKRENVRLRDLIKRLDPNGGELSDLPEPVEPHSESCIIPSPQPQGLERDGVIVPSAQSLLPMKGMEEPRVSQDRREDAEHVELRQQEQVELGSEDVVEGDVSMEGTEDLRFSPDRQEEEEEEERHVGFGWQEQVEEEEEEEEGHVGVGQQVETRPEGQVEEDANDLDNIELGHTEERTKQREEGEQQAAVEEAKKTPRPGSIRIKREVTDTPVWVPANPDDPEIIDLTLDDSDDDSTGASVPSPSPAIPSAPNPTVAGKNAGSLDEATAPRDAKGAHNGDGDDGPMAEVDESALVKATAPGQFCITGVDFDYTDKCLCDVVLQNGAETDNTIPTWGKVLAHLQLIGQASSSARHDIQCTETIEALKDYYVRYLASSPPPSNYRRQPKLSLRERGILRIVPVAAAVEHPADETSPAQEPSTLSQDLEIHVDPCQPDPTQCEDILRLPKVKVEANNFDGDLAVIPACVRRLNQTHLDEIFPTDGDEPLCCAWCEGSEVHYECPAETPLEELSAHVEKHHPEPFHIVLAETAGMNPEEIVEWFTQWDGD